MKTSNFARHGKTPGAISIARSMPRWLGRIPQHSALSPGDWFKSADEQTYRKLFNEQLTRLDPDRTNSELLELAHGHEPILLCWERPNEFCHRRLVARWLEKALHIEVPEIGMLQLQSTLF